jgi:quinoprotein glucose dehydrogenase
MIDGVLFSPNQIGLVEAFDPGTGKTIWLQQPYPDEANGGLSGTATRGVAFWTDGMVRRLFVIRGEYLIALDPSTGRSVPTWGENGRVFLRPGLGPRSTGYTTTTGPQVCNAVVIVGNSTRDAVRQTEMAPGNVQAFDVKTGQSRWVFRVIPGEGPFGNNTWEGDSASYSGQANMWAPASVDQENGLAYLPLSSATSDMYGGHRLGDNLFSDSLVCVKCATGQRVWHYQLVHHDLWDYDIPAAPVLADIEVNGKRIKAVAQITKQAFTFVFDRLTGEPVWPIEERAVPQSDTPGERTSPTQPFPTKPPAFDRQGVTIDDLIDFTPPVARAGARNHREVSDWPIVYAPLYKSGRRYPGNCSVAGLRGRR